MTAQPSSEGGRRKRRRPGGRAAFAILSALWAATLLAPLVILGHAEFKAAGATPGWSFASLDPQATLYSWTRNRMVLWALLFAAGCALLALGRRRDPAGEKLDGLARSPAAAAGALVGAAVVHTALASLEAASVPLVAMLLGLAFFTAWLAAPSGRALAGVVARASLLVGTLLALTWLAEWTMRRPAVIARTGGSAEQRAALRDAAVDPADGRHPLAWRTRLRTPPTPAGTARIFVVGDSFTYGDFVEKLDDLWPFVLEDALVEAGHPVEVTNSGTAGSDTAYQRRVLDAVGWQFDPDVVIVQFTLNDAGPPAYRYTMPLLPVFGTSLTERSALFQLLDAHFRGYQVARSFRDWWPRSFRDGSPGWEACREALDAIARESRERGVSALLLLFPMFDSDLSETGYWNLEAHAAVRRASEEAGLDFLDLRPRLAEIDPNPRRWWARPFDAHPGVEAQHVAGAAVARRLLETGALDRAGAR